MYLVEKEREKESMSVREGGKAVILIACTELKTVKD